MSKVESRGTAVRPRWGWIIPISVGGIMLMGGGGGVVAVTDSRVWGYVAGVMAALGGVLGLSAVVFFAERRFTRTVTDAADAAATRAASSVATDVRETVVAETEQLRRDIREDIDSRFAGLDIDPLVSDAQERTRLAEILEPLDNGEARLPSITLAMRVAGDSGALIDSSVIVPACEDVGGLRLRFQRLDDIRLRISVVPSGKRPSDEYVDVTWEVSQSGEVVFTKLREEMVRSGMAAESRRLSVRSALTSLTSVLRDAQLSRVAASDAPWSCAPVLELIDDGLVVTTDGIELAGAGVLATPAAVAVAVLQPAKFPPPHGIDPKVWGIAIARAHAQYARSDRFDPGWHSRHFG